jgi:hypothetical protein
MTAVRRDLWLEAETCVLLEKRAAKEGKTESDVGDRILSAGLRALDAEDAAKEAVPDAEKPAEVVAEAAAEIAPPAAPKTRYCRNCRRVVREDQFFGDDCVFCRPEQEQKPRVEDGKT